MGEEEGPNPELWKMLSNELRVASEIEWIQAKNEIPYFNKIAQNLATKKVGKSAVHIALNQLIDIGAINAEWVKADHAWVRKFRLSGETADFIRNLNKRLYPQK